MSIFTDGTEYTCTHYWFDSEDNDFELVGTWKYERNYPDAPDYWHLIDVDLDYCADTLPNHIVDLVKEGCLHSGDIWCDVERHGPDFDTLREVDYS